MKIAKLILNIAIVALVISFTSCEKENERTTTHTDNASEMVVGTYTGTIVLDSLTAYEDVTITMTKHSQESVDAVTVTIQSATFDHNGAAGLDLPAYINENNEIVNDPAYLNVSVANANYIISCANPNSARLTGRLNDKDLLMYIPILVFGTQAIHHPNGDMWEFNGVKN